MSDIAISNKRTREDYFYESPEPKRSHAEHLFDILDVEDEDGDPDAGVRDPAVSDLASVMRSLEEEISLPQNDPPSYTAFSDDLTVSRSDLRHHDLGYLLEASDDELGLPPTVPSPSDGGWEVAPPEVVVGDVEDEVDAGFGQIWGFEDGIHGCYDGMSYGIRSDDGGEVFQYADEFFEPSSISDSTWRPESLPAV